MRMMQSAEIVLMSNTAISFVHTGSYPMRSGNLVRPLIDGEPAFRRICEAIEAARHRNFYVGTFIKGFDLSRLLSGWRIRA
jgi:hypothetical protein